MSADSLSCHLVPSSHTFNERQHLDPSLPTSDTQEWHTATPSANTRKLAFSYTGEQFFGLENPCVVELLKVKLTKFLRYKALLNTEGGFFSAFTGANLRSDGWKRLPVSCLKKLEFGQQRNFMLSKLDMEILAEVVVTKRTEAKSDVDGRGGGRVKASKAFDDMPSSMQYRHLASVPPEKRLLLHSSKIHGLGLFTSEFIANGEPVIEYIGDVIRNALSDKREALYELVSGADGSCYMFRLDEQWVVDATEAGNVSRFINHSCEPNCRCRIITCEQGLKHIVIFAKRDLQPGEEITYDYQFGIEGESAKLACHCGAPSCLGRMN